MAYDDFDDDDVVMFPDNPTLVIGDSGVGKTSILMKFARNRFIEEHKPTIGADMIIGEVITDKIRESLCFWDTAGQERYAPLTSSFFRGCDICVLVFDVTNYETFKNIEKWKTEFIKQSDNESERFPYLLLGNKHDLICINDDYISSLNENKQQLVTYGYFNNYNTGDYISIDIMNLCFLYLKASSKRQVSYSEANKYAIKNDMVFYEVSALNGVHIMLAFEAILLRKYEIQQNMRPIFFDDKDLNNNVDLSNANNVNSVNNSNNCYC